jgi:hypothetical protein
MVTTVYPVGHAVYEFYVFFSTFVTTATMQPRFRPPPPLPKGQGYEGVGT